MCKLNASEVVTSFNEIVSKAQSGERTAQDVARKLQAQAAELRRQADALVLLARQLVGNADTNLREPIVLKEGESLRRKKAKEAKAKAKKQRKPIVLTEEQKAYRRELCAKMREKKQQKALVEKFAETKVS